MTKKDKLLNEQTIRRWAKLADVSVLSRKHSSQARRNNRGECHGEHRDRRN